MTEPKTQPPNLLFHMAITGSYERGRQLAKANADPVDLSFLAHPTPTVPAPVTLDDLEPGELLDALEAAGAKIGGPS